MKKLFLSLLVIVCFCSVRAHAQDGYTISGNLNSILSMYAEGSKISSAYIMSDDKIISDKAAVSTDGSFTLSGQVDKPIEACLVVDLIVPGGTGRSSAFFVLEEGEISVNDFLSRDFQGTPLNDAVYNEIKFLMQCSEASEFKMKHVISFIEQYKGTPAVAMVLSGLAIRKLFTMEEMLEIVNASDKLILESPLVETYVSEVKRMLNRTQRSETTGEGQMFVDFEVEYDGHVQRLSDYVGKGKYVLADFWASWCRPCRHDIPEVIELYEKYKDMGLIVLGVTVNDKPENTIKAIRDLGIPYPQIMNGGQLTAAPYGIDTIPHVILFAPDGTIIKRDVSIHDFKQLLQEIFVSCRIDRKNDDL